MRFLIFVLFITLFFLAGISRAEEITPINPNLPGTYSVADKGPVAVVANFYQLALLVSGLLAFAVIVYGAVERIFAAGNPSKISDADERIRDAFLGLLLLAGAYIILNTINPNLTKLALPELKAISTSTGGSSGGGGGGGW